MNLLLALIKKDFLLELRNKQSLSLLVLLSLLLSVVLSVGVTAASIRQDATFQIFPALWWTVFIFSATLSFGRSHEYETEEAALDALLSGGISPAYLFASKCLTNTLIAFIGQCCSLLFLAVLLNVDVGSILAVLLFVELLVAVGYSSLATLLLGVSHSSGLKHLLLPLILLPLVIPLFLGATELSLLQLDGKPFDPGSAWVSLLVGLDVIYFLAGLNLYGAVLRE